MLTPDAIANRKGKMTGSRVKTLVRGDEEEHHNLWLELMDSPQWIPPDYSRKWDVQRGENSEGLNLRWYEGKGNRISRCGEFQQHPSLSWAGVTLDAFDTDLKCPIECKDVQGHEPFEIVIERYQPQCQWQMECTGADKCALSVIIGGAEPRVEYIPIDREYVSELIARGKQFMQHVWDRTPPVILPPVAAPIIADRSVDMSGNESWARHACQWLQVKGAAETARECEKVLKSLVPEDCKKAWGWGVRITRARPFRDRPGALSLREDSQ